MSRLFLILILPLVLFSCRKKDKSSEKGDFKLLNTADKAVNIDIYPSASDYCNVTNIHSKLRIEPNSSATIPLMKFSEDVFYYVDWYSDDYTIGNWLAHPEDTQVHYYVKIKPSRDGSYIIQPTPDMSIPRRVVLSNTEGSSTWDAIGYTNLPVTVTEPLLAGESLEITFRKDHSYTMKHSGIEEKGVFELGTSSVTMGSHYKFAAFAFADSVIRPVQYLDSIIYYNAIEPGQKLYLLVRRK